MIEKMTEADLIKIATQLEAQELDSPGGIASSNVYGQLIAVYLLQNDLISAKLLWKRIPAPIKTEATELGWLWEVGQNLWKKEYTSVYTSLKKEWPEYLKPFTTQLTDKMPKVAQDLVCQAYSTISADSLCEILGGTDTEVMAFAATLGWEVDLATKMVTPKKLAKKQDAVLPSEKQLSRLTASVSFLEN